MTELQIPTLLSNHPPSCQGSTTILCFPQGHMAPQKCSFSTRTTTTTPTNTQNSTGNWNWPSYRLCHGSPRPTGRSILQQDGSDAWQLVPWNEWRFIGISISKAYIRKNAVLLERHGVSPYDSIIFPYTSLITSMYTSWDFSFCSSGMFRGGYTNIINLRLPWMDYAVLLRGIDWSNG